MSSGGQRAGDTSGFPANMIILLSLRSLLLFVWCYQHWVLRNELLSVQHFAGCSAGFHCADVLRRAARCLETLAATSQYISAEGEGKHLNVTKESQGACQQLNVAADSGGEV